MVLGSSFFSSDSEGHDRRGDHRPGQRSTRARQALGRRSAGARRELGRTSAGARQELGRSSAGARTTFDLALQASNRRPSPAAHLPPTLPANGRTVLKRGCRAGRPLVGRTAVDRPSGPVIQTSSGRLGISGRRLAVSHVLYLRSVSPVGYTLFDQVVSTTTTGSSRLVFEFERDLKYLNFRPESEILLNGFSESEFGPFSPFHHESPLLWAVSRRGLTRTRVPPRSSMRAACTSAGGYLNALRSFFALRHA